MQKPLSREQAIVELWVAGFLWGFGFIAVRWGLEGMGPLWLNFFRFLLSGIVGTIPLCFLGGIRGHFTRREFWLSAGPGLWLGATLILQTYGLQHTTVARSGFITTLYIVFVPILDRILYRQKVSSLHFVWVAVALVGAALICQVDSWSMNIGDFLTLLCAMTAAMQILQVGRISQRSESAYAFSLGQCFWAGLLPAMGAFLWEPLPEFPLSLKVFAGLFSLAVGSTLVAFAIQLRAQRVLNSSIVSLFFLLESPFAALLGYWLLSEPLSVGQIAGAATILVAAAGTILRPASPSAA